MMTSGEILNSGFGEMLEKIFYNAPGGFGMSNLTEMRYQKNS
jgi:hypothetical protein